MQLGGVRVQRRGTSWLSRDYYCETETASFFFFLARISDEVSEPFVNGKADCRDDVGPVGGLPGLVVKKMMDADAAAAVDGDGAAAAASADAGGGGGGGDAKALTPAQLLDYIKKQKVKIKKLEREKEVLAKQLSDSHDAVAAANAANAAAATAAATAAAAAAAAQLAAAPTPTPATADDRALLWGVLDVHQSPRQRQLAVAALRPLFARFDSVPSKQRSVFDRWHVRTLAARADASTKEAAEAKAASAALEQKTAKLKALLARTHQANKRIEEDSSSFKRAQRDAVLQLKAMREREDGERAQLLETVRVRTIESAFQQDMELAIQRAAESMIKSGADVPTEHAPTGKMATLVEENGRLTTQLAEAEAAAAAARAEASTSQTQLGVAEREVGQLKHALEKATAKAVALEGQVAEGQRLRHDMEMELELLTKGRADMIRGVEVAMAEKSAQQIAELKAQLNAALKAAAKTGPGLPAHGKGGGGGGSSSSTTTSNSSSSSSSSGGSGGVSDEPMAPPLTSLSLGGGLITPGLFARRGAPTGTMTAVLDVDGWDGGRQSSPSHSLSSPASFSSSSSSSSSLSASATATAAAAAAAAATTTYLCESLIIRARDDFRLVVPLPAGPSTAGSYRLSWDFTVAVPQPPTPTPTQQTQPHTKAPRTSNDRRGRAVDIGFSVMEQLSTGSLPQLLPYSRVKSPGARSTIVLGAAMTDAPGGDNFTSFSRSLILLFDNSYSWLQSKEIRYTVTVESLS